MSVLTACQMPSVASSAAIGQVLAAQPRFSGDANLELAGDLFKVNGYP
jgi:hypothetical protein